MTAVGPARQIPERVPAGPRRGLDSHAHATAVPAGQHAQSAPYPHELADLVVARCRFRPGYKLWLAEHDDQGCKGLSLWIRTDEMDTYHPDQPRPVHHIFYVPTAAYNRECWCWWLFQRLHAVSQHEDMEWFRLGLRTSASTGPTPRSTRQAGTRT